MKISFAAPVVIALLCVSAVVRSAAAPPRVSMIQLLANPESFDGKIVRVRGYVHLEFESSSIYLHKDDYVQDIKSNGLWIDVSECSDWTGEKKFTSGYAEVEGRFSATEHGHMGLWPGALVGTTGCTSYIING